MSVREKLMIVVDADVKGAIREVDKLGSSADKSLSKANSKLDKFAGASLKAGTAMIGASVAIGFGLAKTVGAAQESEDAQIRLANSVKNSKVVADGAVGSFNNQAKALQRVTAASDEQVNSAQAMLVQFGATKSQVLALTPLVVDLARKMGVDTVTAAKAVGKTLDGNSGALKRMGVSVDTARFANDRFGATMSALKQAAGGFAQREGKTFAGQLAIIKNQANELEESIGRGVIGVLKDVLPAATGAAKGLGQVDEATGGAIGKFAAIGTAGGAAVGGLLVLAGGLAKLKASLIDTATEMPRVAAAAKGLGAVVALAAGIMEVKSAFDQIAGAGEKSAAALSKGLVPGSPQFQNNLNTANERLQALVKTYNAMGSGLPGNRRGQAIGEIFQEFAGADVSKGVIATSAEIRKLTANIEAAAAAQTKLNRGVGNVRFDGLFKGLDTSGISADKISRLADVMGVNLSAGGKKGADAVSAVQRALISAGGPTDQAAQLAINFAVAQGKASDATGRQARALAEEQTALDKRNSAVMSAIDLTLTEQSQQKTLNDDIKNQADALAIAQDASSLAKTRVEEFNQALVLSGKPALTATQQTQNYLDQLKFLASQSPATAQALNPLIWQTQAFIDKAAAANPVDIGVNPGNSIETLDQLNTRIAALRDKDITITVHGQTFNVPWSLIKRNTDGSPDLDGNPNNTRASGGPVSRNTPYVVGEKGPEIFVPNSSGRIINATDSAAHFSAASSSGGNTYNINVTAMKADAQVGKTIVEAIRAHERNSGKSWRAA